MDNASTTTVVTEKGQLEATRIGHSSSARPGAPRWTEVTVYRSANEFIIEEIGRSLIDGEVDRVRTQVSADARTLVAGLVRGKKGLAIVAEEAVNAAADSDPAFAASLRDVLDVEDVGTGAPAPGSLLVTLPRDYDRALRVRGRTIAYVSSRSGDKPRWSEITIFALDSGGYAVSNVGRTATGEDERFAARTGDALAILETLLRYGGLTEIAFDALESAVRADQNFARDLADRHRKIPALHALRRSRSQPRMRFAGIRLASDTGSVKEGSVATDVYRTTEGKYVVGQVLHPLEPEAEAQYSAMGFETATLLVSALRGMSRVANRPALLRAAGEADPRVAEALGGDA